jgi:hypothetical protein
LVRCVGRWVEAIVLEQLLLPVEPHLHAQAKALLPRVKSL